jgi:hypothetical protein
MIESTTEDIWQRASRAYLFLRIAGQTEKSDEAEGIFALNMELETSNHFIVRTTLVKGPYDIIVPVYARDPDRLAEVIELVMSRDGIDPETSDVVYLEDALESDRVHHPWPPHEASGYIPLDESNPIQPGLTGRNAWG